MGASTRKAVKKAEQQRISNIGDIKARSGGLMELPSGITVRVVNPGGLKAFMKSGIIPNSLMVIIQESLKTGKKPKPQDILNADGSMDDNTIADMDKLMSGVALECIKEPKFLPDFTEEDVKEWNKKNPFDQVEEPYELEDDDKLYIHELPDDDKQFIFQWISGGTRDLELFRERQKSGMGSLAEVSSSLASTKPDNGASAG